jgi:hypothetical protein
LAGGLDVGITSATCDILLGRGKKVIGRRNHINYIKSFKVYGQSEPQGGKNECGSYTKTM